MWYYCFGFHLSSGAATESKSLAIPSPSPSGKRTPSSLFDTLDQTVRTALCKCDVFSHFIYLKWCKLSALQKGVQRHIK